jgi:hypothetical protein
MIADKPIAAAAGPADIATKVSEFIAAAKAASANGLTVAEFAELTLALLKIAVAAADSIPVDGAARKSWVVDAVGLLFDAVADKMVPVVAWPLWIVFRSSVRSLVLAAAGGAVEAILPLVRSVK